jgi:hypothetical protein
MPSSKTITAYNVFTAGTKAKSSEVNTNFSNYRGHSLPINTDTASASDLTHDLGGDTHRWNAAYVGSIDLETSTTTASLVLQGQTSNTTGAFEFLIEGTTAAVIGPNSIIGPSTTNVISKLQYAAFTASGTWTSPAGVTSAIVLMAGGGGGGGGGGGNTGGGGSGGGGVVPALTVINISESTGYSITVGTGGSGGAGGASGATGTIGGVGGNTFFSSLLSAVGGAGGFGGQPNSGATTAADTNGFTSARQPSHGGYGAPAFATGASGLLTNYASGGAGGAASGGGGGGGGGGAALNAGAAGGAGAASGAGSSGSSGSQGSGGGGGGGGSSGNAGGSGGNGGSGVVLVYWIKPD